MQCEKWYHSEKNVNVNNLPRTIAFLKAESVVYTLNKFIASTADQIAIFLLELPDEKWLFNKLILIFDQLGASRRDDFGRRGRYWPVFDGIPPRLQKSHNKKFHNYKARMSN